MIALLLKAGKARVAAVAGLLVVVTAFIDWAVGRNVSLAVLYIVPMMLAAVVLRPAQTAMLAVICAYLRAQFDTPGSTAEHALRFIFAVLAYLVSGLFVTELVRNRERAIEHLSSVRMEQALRLEAEEQLRLLAESSPAAILTTDSRGVVLAANSAADSLFSIPQGQTLRGRQIANYLPVLSEALRIDVQHGDLRTAAQFQGHRENGDIFLAHTWFSSYATKDGTRLAAIVVDSSEEMREREEEGLEQLLRGNRIAAAAVSHEVRNFCVAMGLLCGNLRSRDGLGQDPDMQGLMNLVSGLESIASLQLQPKSMEELERVALREILDNLRIVIEGDWREIEGSVHWRVPQELPPVIGESHGLLQAFLNLAQNSHRAVQQESVRELTITAVVEADDVVVRFADSGPGITDPGRLFEPFQKGAAGTGLGLYVSRFIVRSYGGELRFEPSEAGSCFAVELQRV